LIDEICRYLYSKMATEEWTSLDELYEIVKRHCLGKKEMEDSMMNFLKKYFIEVDESKQKVRLSSWAYNLFEISI